ncbi:MAG: hypothetical protein A2189_05530 [Paenibacillus sp. RIFOXYA1_FULL_44_5]|nr:MAG: hypothetical protein A2189_05530 [Paenibacillus sp. RIFOXYA1_FULL_44_5]
MRSSRLLWSTVGLSGLLATFLFIFGFIAGAKNILFPPLSGLQAAPNQPAANENIFQGTKIQMVALGDSLSKGTGDDTGRGYVGDLREMIASTSGKPTYIIGNLAINGYTSSQLLHDLETNKGLVNTLGKADLITVTIGGNDLFHLGEDVVDASVINKRMPTALQNVKQILTEIRKMNQHAVILYVGLYNPFQDLPNSSQIALAIEKWNDSIFNTVSQNPHMVFIPTYDLFSFQFMQFLYSDHFHPNQEGYNRIAARILQVLEPELPKKGGVTQ